MALVELVVVELVDMVVVQQFQEQVTLVVVAVEQEIVVDLLLQVDLEALV
jgi:hypothetical protein|tara:strand:+ start:337 stop:486 length:150 start_codon:yes stop_codon:yes gene_type:complete